MGYMFMPLCEQMQKVLPIITQWGLYENFVLLHCILSATDIFEQLMQSFFVNMPAPPIIYINDLLYQYNDTIAEHLEIVDIILTYLEAAGMQINAEKTSWGSQDIEFLGFLLRTDAYKPLPSQIQGIVDMLVQEHGVIGCFLQKFNSSQLNYTMTEKELLAITIFSQHYFSL